MAQKPRFKISIKRLPDFKLRVKFVMPNDEEADIVFTVKHKTIAEMQGVYFTEDEKPATDFDVAKAIVTGWDLEEDFNDENLQELFDLFPGITVSLINAYMQALIGNRKKN